MELTELQHIYNARTFTGNCENCQQSIWTGDQYWHWCEKMLGRWIKHAYCGNCSKAAKDACGEAGMNNDRCNRCKEKCQVWREKNKPDEINYTQSQIIKAEEVEEVEGANGLLGLLAAAEDNLAAFKSTFALATAKIQGELHDVQRMFECGVADYHPIAKFISNIPKKRVRRPKNADNVSAQ